MLCHVFIESPISERIYSYAKMKLRFFRFLKAFLLIPPKQNFSVVNTFLYKHLIFSRAFFPGTGSVFLYVCLYCNVRGFSRFFSYRFRSAV